MPPRAIFSRVKANCVQDRGLPGEMIIVKQKIQFQGPGKFRGVAEPAVYRVEILQEEVRRGLHGFPGGVAAAPLTTSPKRCTWLSTFRESDVSCSRFC